MKSKYYFFEKINKFLDSTPLVVITGNVPTNKLGQDSFQEVDIYGITMPVVKYSYLCKNVADLEQMIVDSFEIAKSGRPGPVLIDIPKDILSNKCEAITFNIFIQFNKININMNNFLTAKISLICRPIAKSNTQSNNQISIIFQSVCQQIAKSGRPGPVLIDIPKDILSNKCEYYGNLTPKIHKKVLNYVPDYQKAIELINQSKKHCHFFFLLQAKCLTKIH